MNNHTVIGVDLAKTVFQVAVQHGQKITSNKKLNRSKLVEFMTQQLPSVVVMEACYTAHYWARVCEALGHTVRLIPAQHVKPFTRGNKTDANDAIAIIEAAQRPNMIDVPVKTQHQQDIQSLHRIRERLVCNRTGLMNQVRGLLAEYGLISAKGNKGFVALIELALNTDELSPLIKDEVQRSLDELQLLRDRTEAIEATLREYLKSDPHCQIISTIPGIGVINATALVCKFGNGSQFSKARSLAVNLGLTPKLSASGLRSQMQGISKRGDPYLRKQLIHGARALLGVCDKRPDDALCRWASRIKQRRGGKIATVAIANRLARLVWVLLHKQEAYRPMTV